MTWWVEGGSQVKGAGQDGAGPPGNILSSWFLVQLPLIGSEDGNVLARLL